MQLTEFIKELVERNGSDLHLVAGLPPAIRVQGALSPLEHSEAAKQPLRSLDVRDLLNPYLSTAQQDALDRGEDVAASLSLDGNYAAVSYGAALRLRTCIFSDRGGISAALRAIPTKIPTMDQLFTPETEAVFRRLIDQRRGLILMVGPTGSGKSTSTASMIHAINRERSERILTIEDPVEYTHSSIKSMISQREVGTDVENYEQGGLSALRSDPDTVLIGELRTPEAARIALALADLGRLVFSTLHAETVSEAVRRLVEAFPDRTDTMRRIIARSLNAVVSQRLVPRANGQGRVPAHEIMIVNSRIRRLIEEGQNDFTLAIEAGRAEGMRTMDDSLLALYADGTISYECAWDAIRDSSRLGPRLQ